VLVENFRVDTLRFFGLDYETLAARNPRLIYASITGYGQGGPWQGRMAYAPTVQAEAEDAGDRQRRYARQQAVVNLLLLCEGVARFHTGRRRPEDVDALRALIAGALAPLVQEE
jgi:hypothetical protein